MKTTWGRLASLSLVVFTTGTLHASTYYLQSMGGTTGSPPFPNDPYEGAEPITTIDAAREIYRVDDNTNDWEMLTTAKQLDAMSASSTTMTTSDSTPPPSPGGTNTSGGTNYTVNALSNPLVIGSNDLWIEITNVDMVNQQASLILHSTIPDDHYQLLSTNALSTNGQTWTLGEYIIGAADTNETPFSVVNVGTNSQMFFRAHHAYPVLAIQANQNAIEPNPNTGDPGQIGQFLIQSYFTLTNDLPVQYLISGTAQSGIDYSNLSGSITIPASTSQTNINIAPLFDGQVDGIETVTLTIQQTNDYLIDPNASSATITIADSSTTVSVFPYSGDAIKPGGPPGDPAVNGQFRFSRFDSRSGSLPQMTVYYTVSGTSTNGEDYTLLSGTLDFADGESDTFLDVTPLADIDYDGIETVTVTLTPTNSYLIDPAHSDATINIDDSSTTVSITKVQDAIETNSVLRVGQVGIFNVHRDDARGDRPQMTVNYSISGTASNGVDYVTLSGTVTFASGESDTNIFVQTLQDNLLEGDETVTLTLTDDGNAYLISDSDSNATVIIHDTVVYSTPTSNLPGDIGVDYNARSNALIVSFNYSGGSPTFAEVYTNIVISNGVPVTNTIVTNWSNIGGLQDEVYLTVVKAAGGLLTNSAGFTNGDTFFGSGSGIGWLSADTTQSNLDWCILTNSVVTNALLLRGGICMDQTGTFSNQLIAVTSPSDVILGPKGIWRVDSQAHPTLLTNIFTEHLEGVTTLTNDLQKWGPWAGKIITGDESHSDPVTGAADPVIYTIDTDGVVATNHTLALISGGIFPEDFHVIPPNQNCYFTAYNNSSLMELPSSYFTNYVGDLLVSQAGEAMNPGLFIVRWDSQASNFVTISIPLPQGFGSQIEGSTFAPIQIPPQ